MKQTLLTIILLMTFTTSHAQYTSMLEEGSEWYYYFWFEASCNEILSVQGDSLINEVNYKQVHTNEPCNHDYITLLREDSITRQVFLWRSGDTEIVIYDYSLAVDDTLFLDTSYYDSFLILDSISHILPDNNSCVESMYPMSTLENPKVFYWRTTLGGNKQVIWIEGIGNITDPLNSTYIWTEGALGDQLLCHVDSEGIRDYHDFSFFYEEPLFCQGPLLDTRSFKALNNQLKVYPNPAVEEIRISVTADQTVQLEQISFYDVTGRFLKKQTLGIGETIRIADLKPGLIFGVVEASSGELFGIRFVKQ